jgi:hypothetical protein
LHFVITKVNHQLRDNAWETSLDTISIPVTKEQNLELQAPVYNNRDEGIEVTGPIPPTDTSGRRFLIIENRNIDEITKRRTELLRNQQPQNYAPPGEIIGVTKVLQNIHPDAKSTFSKFFTALEENYPGYKMKLNAIGRTFSKSESLREKNSSNARPGFSKHNYYAAIDFNIIDPNGVTYMKGGDRAKWIESGIIREAKKVGLEWGGDFANYEDCIHFSYNFNIKTAYNNAVIIARKKGIDITQVDGYKVPLKPLGPEQGPQTEAEAANNNFPSILTPDS